LSIVPDGLNHLHLSKSFKNNATKQGCKRPNNDLKDYNRKIARYSTYESNHEIPISSTEENKRDKSTGFPPLVHTASNPPKCQYPVYVNREKMQRIQSLPLKPNLTNFPNIPEITQAHEPPKICELSPNLDLSSPIDLSLSQNFSHSKQVSPSPPQIRILSPPQNASQTLPPPLVLGPQLRELLSETSSFPDMQTFPEGNRKDINAELQNTLHQLPPPSSTQFPSNSYLLSVYPPPPPRSNTIECQALVPVNNNNRIQVRPRDWLHNPLLYFQGSILLPALLLPNHPKVKYERYALTWLCLVWGYEDYNLPLTNYESEMMKILKRNYDNARIEVQLPYGEKIALFQILENSSIMRKEFLSDIVIPLINLDYLPEQPPIEFSPIELFHLKNLKRCNLQRSTYDKRHKSLETFVAKCRLNNN
jgi:hypothetical protein